MANPALHVSYRHLQHSKQWMLTLYAQASNTFITSHTYQKWSGDVIPGISCRYCSVNNLQDRVEYGLIKTLLISSASYLNLRSRSFVWGAKWWRDWILGPCDSVPPIGDVEGGWYGSDYEYWAWQTFTLNENKLHCFVSPLAELNKQKRILHSTARTPCDTVHWLLSVCFII